MLNSILHPDDMIKLYPIEKLEKMSEDEVVIFAKEYIKSLVYHSSNKNETRKEIDEILSKIIKCKSEGRSNE